MIERNMKEKISALMDGELDQREMDAVLGSLKQDESLLQDWVVWQAGGDALKGRGVASTGFIARFSLRLDAEPVVLVRRNSLRRFALPVALAASVGFVGIAMWQYYGVQAVPVASNQIATETEATLHDYLVAHRRGEGNPFADREMIQAQFHVAVPR